MRSMGRLTTGLALLSLLPAVAAAQEARPFTNAWFWGAKGGVMSVKTPVESEMAPTVGAEWMITRTRTGLYVAMEQGFFDSMLSVVPDTLNGGSRGVNIRNFRRASFALMGYPATWGAVRPYVGIGMALNLVQRAEPVGTFHSTEHKAEVVGSVEDRRSRTSVLFMGGVQGAVLGVNLFAQGTAMPTGSRFLLSGSDATYMLEAGVRFNVGSAIERIDR
jgi:hypothetical protein